MKDLIEINWLNENINDESLVILDASPKTNKSNLSSEFENLQIPGARYFDLKNVFSDKASDMPNTLPQVEDFEKAVQDLGIHQESKIVVYDNLGIYASPRVWWMFKAMGHEDIAVLDGGLQAWVKEGHATEATENASYKQGNFVAAPNYEMKKDMQDVLVNIDAKNAIVLDARSHGRYCGTAPEPREGLSSGHIPNSLSLPWTEVVEDGKMKSKEALKKLFDGLKLEAQPIIFSCGSGLTACIIMLAASLVMENKMAVYDGSWTEWAQKQEALIVK